VSTCFLHLEIIDVCLNCDFDAFEFICVFVPLVWYLICTNEKKLKMCDISFVQMKNAENIIHLKIIGDIVKVSHIAVVQTTQK